MSEKNIFVKIRSKKFQKRGDFSYWAQYDDFSRITLFSNFRAQCALSRTLSLSLLLPLNRLTERKQREWRERILTKGFFPLKTFSFLQTFYNTWKGSISKWRRIENSWYCIVAYSKEFHMQKWKVWNWYSFFFIIQRKISWWNYLEKDNDLGSQNEY